MLIFNWCSSHGILDINVGRIINFTNFNKIPLFLIIASLGIRAIRDFFVPIQTSFSPFRDDIISFLVHKMLTYCFSISGWLVIASMRQC